MGLKELVNDVETDNDTELKRIYNIHYNHVSFHEDRLCFACQRRHSIVLAVEFHLQSEHVISFVCKIIQLAILHSLHSKACEFILQRGKAAIGPCFEFCFQIFQSSV